MAIGPILREARQGKQLTTSQVAEMTRMKVQIVDDLENDDFHRIAATIYGKGFIKLYAECVDLDPEPLIDDYMEQVGSPQPPKLPKVKKQSTPPPPSESTEQKDSDEFANDINPSSDDLFSYAVQNRQRKNNVSVSTEASPSTAATPTTSKQTVHRWIFDISNSTKKLFLRAKETCAHLTEASIKHFTEAGEHDKWIQRALLAIGILVIILILIPIGRMFIGRHDTDILHDDDLIQFIPPPELYQE